MHRLAASWALAGALAAAGQPPEPPAAPGPEEKPEVVISDAISVELAMLTVRAVDRGGRPLLGLTAEDFLVRSGKHEVPTLAADWVSASTGPQPLAAGAHFAPPQPGRGRSRYVGNPVILFFQADFNSVRIKGHLRMLPMIDSFLAGLHPDDWVAVASFDSQLKLWQDFSRDREATGAVIDRAFRFGGKPPLERPQGRSLARVFPFEEARRAATPERALRLLAEALEEIPGEKVLVYLGWALGELHGRAGVVMSAEYDLALAALHRARTSVFVLDVTDADYHTLETTIRQVALDTGGTYAKTKRFAQREIQRVREAISGYYLLTLDRSALPPDPEPLRITLRGIEGRVLTRSGAF